MNRAALILNYNSGPAAEKLLESFLGSRVFDACILVDNASTDDSLFRLQQQFGDRVIFLKAEENRGYGAGNNLGLTYARDILQARYVLIANPDVEIDAETVKKLTEILEKDPALAVCAPVMRLTGVHGKALIPGTRDNALAGPPAQPLRPWFADLLSCGPICRRLFASRLYYPAEAYQQSVAPVGMVPGSLLLVDTEKMQAAGGYDENVFLYEEEFILGQRLKKAGYGTALYTKSSYVHRHAPVNASRKTEASAPASAADAASGPDSCVQSEDTASLLQKQKLREASTLYYYQNYLGIGPGRTLFTKLFFAFIRGEIRICSRFS